MPEIKFKKRSKIGNDIPTGPMADISFLLIIFFMVTTVFVVYRGFSVDLPFASQLDSIKSRRNMVSIWVGADGRMMVDEFNVSIEDVANVVNDKLQENPNIIVQVKADRTTPYRVISDVIEELKRGSANRVSFIAKQEQ